MISVHAKLQTIHQMPKGETGHKTRTVTLAGNGRNMATVSLKAKQTEVKLVMGRDGSGKLEVYKNGERKEISLF